MSLSKRPLAKTARVKELTKQLRQLCPQMPLADFTPVLEAAAARHLKHLPPSIALWQALGAHVRHTHTDYDSLLEDGYDRDSARFFVVEAMNETLRDWGCSQRVSGEGE